MKNVKSYKFNKWQLSLCILLFAALLWKIIFTAQNYPYSAFINTDPAADYMSSAVELIENGRAYYSDHPGCPYYIAIAAALTPVKVYSLLHGYAFTELIYTHIEALLIYIQFLTMAVSLTGLYLTAKSIVILTGFWPAALAGILLFFNFDIENLRRSFFVTPEGFILFLSGIVLYNFTRYLNAADNRRPLYIALFILGIGFATKITIFPLGLFICISYFLETKAAENVYKALAKLLYASGIAAAGFIAGIAVLGKRAGLFFNHIYEYMLFSEWRGFGEPGINIDKYFFNLTRFYSENVCIYIAIIILLCLIIVKVNKRSADDNRLIRICAAGLASFIMFSFIAVKVTDYNMVKRYMIIGNLVVSFITGILLSLNLKSSDIFKQSIRGLLIAVGLCYMLILQLNNKENTLQIQAQKDVENVLKKIPVNDASSNVVLCTYRNYGLGRELFFLRGMFCSFNVYDEVYRKHLSKYLFLAVVKPDGRSSISSLGKAISSNRKIVIYKGKEIFDGRWQYAVADTRTADALRQKWRFKIVSGSHNIVLLKNIQ